MPKFAVDVGKATYEVEAPDERTAWAWANHEHNSMPSFADVKGGTAAALVSRTERVLKGAKDTLDAAAQVAYNALPKSVQQAGNKLNNFIADKTGLVSKIPDQGINELIANDEKAYQAGRESAGSTGFDAYRAAGNIASTLPLAAAIPATAPTLGGRVGLGMLAGGVSGGLQPVTQGEFLPEKAKQVGVGAAFGGAIPLAGAGISRIISPNASVNHELQALKDAGVRPTVGQALGGAANRIEEKLQSVPIMGDAITAARRDAVEDFNKATINNALTPIGAKVNEAGTQGISDASKAISTAYTNALNKLGGVKFDGQFAQELQSLNTLAQNLTPDMARKFENELRNRVIGRMSPSGGMHAETFKKVDSELGALARDYGKSVMGSEKEFANAIRELQASIRRQAERVSTEYSAGVKPADAAYAQMVRVQTAGKKAALHDAVFTPGQLMQAVREADSSGRKVATARGDAMLQDWAMAGQNVLGNKYPDSGTAGRMLLGIGGLASGAINPGIPVALGAGALAYMTPAQRLAVALASSRPQGASALAQLIRNGSPRLGAAGGVLGNAMVNQ